tara:strand:+ start:3503 stop:4312 length:810 start_codon:yes stop_codon:yes gene_type:complete
MEDFKSAQNKGLLWNLLYEGGVFHGISGERVETVKEKLEQVVEETWDRRVEGDDLKELNKRVCQMMLVASERIRTQSIPASMTSAPPLVTAEELSTQRQAAFSNNLERKQSEFTQMMTNDRPRDIDFTDKPEEPLVALDQALEELQARRTRELNKALGSQDPTAAAAWIQGDADGADTNKHIKIGEEAMLDDGNIQHIAEEKKVRFRDPPPSKNSGATDFLEKLKTTKPPAQPQEPASTSEQKTVEDRLLSLEKGQKTIIAMLSQLLTK